ncbi:MAG: apolipoprotein N-acyltransferase [Bacteroidales bacterium]|nr:apolipoprotein N-acyltransferase [Bacteroidales bacterium]
MKRERLQLWVCAALTAVLLSIPYLVPGCGAFSLVAFIPLLVAERLSFLRGGRHFWICHYSTFLAWNLVTTFWVCNATVGGGLFASFANALQMSLVFGLFRWVKKRWKGVLPYIFLAFMWIAWERCYLTVAQISWPWLVLGNSFARTLPLVQWYEYTGTLGGSLWVWTVNLLLFGLMVALSDGSFGRWLPRTRVAAITSAALAVVAPIALSLGIWFTYKETDDPLEVLIVQPNIDPYNKFTAMTQQQQNAILLDQMERSLRGRDSSALLILTPETFTSDIVTGNVEGSRTFRRMSSFLSDHPWANMILGASTRDFIASQSKPSHTARPAGDGYWRESHNSALMLDGRGNHQIFHKSKLVVGVEMTPYPAFFTRIDDMLGGVMGRDVGQDSISVLRFSAAGREASVGCAICYESIYGEYCTGYVRAGADVLAVITNDAWWGDTPGYVQHLSYSSLRAVETRRDIARCANTGISAVIDQRGRILERTPWWEQAELSGTVNLNRKETFYVRWGDIIGRISVFMGLMLLLAALVRAFVKRDVTTLDNAPAVKRNRVGK